MIRADRLPLAGLLALLAVSIAPTLAGTEPDEPTLEQRIAALEARVRELEVFLGEALGYGETDSAAVTPLAQSRPLPVRVTRKRFEPQDAAHARWEDYIRLDVEIDTTPLAKPAIALKGTLEFADAFGETRFTMPAQINADIQPGTPLRREGLDFEFNQFHEAHKWMLATDPKQMVVAYRLAAVMYADGTSEQYR